jgi:hypothetical protein
MHRGRRLCFAAGQPVAPGGPGYYSVTGLAVRLGGLELQAVAAVVVAVVVDLANHASFFPNPVPGLTSSFQGRCAGLKACF